MTSQLAAAFAAARRERRAVLVGYLPAGFPTVDASAAALARMVAAGVEVVEVGLPYSDPVIDGPVIQTAVDRALAGGTRLSDVFRVVEAVAATGAATVVMTYWNPVERRGAERFAAELAAAGACGAITPDLLPDEAGPWRAAAAAHGLDPVFLVAPSSTDERIRKVAEASRGFVYAASTMGVTGTRAELDARAPKLVARVRQATDLPVGVGLGVGNGAQAREVAGYADAVIVGTAFVRALLDAPDQAAGFAAVERLAGELAGGVRGAQLV